MKYIHILFFCLGMTLCAQTAQWYRSNEFFFEIAPITEGSRARHTHTLSMERSGDKEIGYLYQGNTLVGKLERNYEQGSDRILEETFLEADGSLIEALIYTYNAEGIVVSVRRRLPDDQSTAIRFTADDTGLKEVAQLDVKDTIETVRYDELGRLADWQQWRDNALVVEESSEYKEEEVIVKRTYSDGSVLRAVYMDDHIVSELYYKDDATVRESRFIYDEKGRMQQRYITEEGKTSEIRYSYDEGDMLVEELWIQEGLPLRLIIYGADESKEELLYWEGQLVLKNIYGEEKLLERIFYKNGQIVQRYAVDIEE